MADSPTTPAEFAVFDRDLDKAWTDRYLQMDALAVDTEDGLIHGRDRLNLVQIADQEDRVACVRIALGQSEAPQLRRLMEAETVEKVFHFARFDVGSGQRVGDRRSTAVLHQGRQPAGPPTPRAMA